jgi:hypothetical protein
VRLTGGTGREAGNPQDDVAPLEGSPEDIADGLRAYAAAGIGHVQLVLDPITEASIASLGPVLELLEGR